jgi:hypothetical protein
MCKNLCNFAAFFGDEHRSIPHIIVYPALFDGLEHDRRGDSLAVAVQAGEYDHA